MELVVALFRSASLFVISLGLGILVAVPFVAIRFGISHTAAFHVIIARIREWLGQ